MIIVTGAAGFIGSCLAKFLLERLDEQLVLVDDFSKENKTGNLTALQGLKRVERAAFFEWLNDQHDDINAVFHIGARTDTTEFDRAIFDELNLNFTKKLWRYCAERGVVLIYASSAATYGGGEFGYDDNHEIVEKLKPLNPYGESKNDFDKWALAQTQSPPHWYGLKFFNVFGPNEYHKGRMASVIFHAFNQIQKSGEMKLFRSHNPNYADGGQLRDFVYVKDVLSVIHFLYEKRPVSGIYNLGSGKARTFLDLAGAVFHALGKAPNVSFIDTPADIRDKYQYFTEANMAKLREAGYSNAFYDLESGVEDYVRNYLEENRFY